MDGNYNYRNDGHQQTPPGTPQAPMQYFTSGSGHGFGTPPMRYTSSTPNYRQRPPRVQQPHHSSPYGEQQRYGSPYSGGFTNSFNNRSSYSPRYTPSPVRPRNFSPHSNSPNTSYGRGAGSFRGRGRGMGRPGERAPTEMYFKEDMLRDPWQGLQPYHMTESSFTK